MTAKGVLPLSESSPRMVTTGLFLGRKYHHVMANRFLTTRQRSFAAGRWEEDPGEIATLNTAVTYWLSHSMCLTQSLFDDFIDSASLQSGYDGAQSTRQTSIFASKYLNQWLLSRSSECNFTLHCLIKLESQYRNIQQLSFSVVVQLAEYDLWTST